MDLEKVLKIIFDKPVQIEFTVAYIKTTFAPTYEDYRLVVKEEYQLIQEEFEWLIRYYTEKYKSE